MRRNRRKRKLIRLDLQLKVVFITLFVASLVLLINFQLTLAGLWSLSNQFLENKSVDVLLDGVRSSAIQKFLISVCMAVPLAASVGILYSFKFCGPIYRFKTYMSDLSTGRWDERCLLRENDDLQDVCDAINSGVEAFRERVRHNHTLLQDVKTLLDDVKISGGSDAKARLQAIQERLDEEDAVFQQRFGGAEEPLEEAEDDADGQEEAEAEAEAVEQA